jgi:hypothetical protein
MQDDGNKSVLHLVLLSKMLITREMDLSLSGKEVCTKPALVN